MGPLTQVTSSGLLPLVENGSSERKNSSFGEAVKGIFPYFLYHQEVTGIVNDRNQYFPL